MKHTLFLVLAICLFFLLPRDSFAVSRTVCSSGCTYTTIQAAITASTTGDTIKVGPGTYAGFTVNKQVIIESEDFNRANPKLNTIKINGSVTVTGSWAWDQGPTIRGFSINAADAIIGNAPFIIEYNYGTGGGDIVSFEPGGGGIVRGNYLENSGDDCIDVDNQTKEILIENNTMTRCGQDGIEIRQQNDTISSRATLTFRNNFVDVTGEDSLQIMDYDNFSNRRYILQRNVFRNAGKAGIGIMVADITNQNYSAAAMPEPLYAVNNTFINNDAGISGGANLIAINNIFSGQKTFDLKAVGGKSKVINSVFAATPKLQGTNNLDNATTKIGDPKLDASLVPQAGSLAIDAGIASYSHTYTFNGQNINDTVVSYQAGSDYIGSAPDSGWKESGSTGAVTPTIGGVTPTTTASTPIPTTSIIVPTQQPGMLLAFPGAEGYGAETVGGRGGRVIEVTTLSDSGAGSLRACVESSGPRICIFRIGGTIELMTRLDVINPYLTIAGQVAPGGGITLKTHSSNPKGLLVVRDTAHDVIIRYIRVRTGVGGSNGDTLDGITINAKNVIVDHVSASWGVDETVNTWYPTAQNITIQWSIISEALSNANHPKGEHSKGFLMGEFNKNVTVHHTLFAHNMDRHPEIKGDPTGVLESINNVIYNFGDRTTLVSDNNGVAKANIIGNFYKKGPSSPDKYEIYYYNSVGAGVRMFVKGNIGPHRANDTNKSFVRTSAGEWSVVSTDTPDAYLVQTQFTGAKKPVTIQTATEAYDEVIADSGNSRMLQCDGNWTARRDAVDTRVINDVKNGTGKIIDNPSQVGGWPPLAAGTPCADADKDGMFDEWETKTFGSITSSSGTTDKDGDGYTDLEEFLNSSTAGSGGTTVIPTPGGGGSCAKKNIGDADCKSDTLGKAVSIFDYAIWYSEFIAGCSEANISRCGANADGVGNAMDANFNFPGTNYLKSDTVVDVFDYAVWLQGFLVQ